MPYADPEKRKAHIAEYLKAHRESIQARKVEYRRANKESIQTYMAEYYKVNRQSLRAQQAEHYEYISGPRLDDLRARLVYVMDEVFHTDAQRRRFVHALIDRGYTRS